MGQRLILRVIAVGGIAKMKHYFMRLAIVSSISVLVSVVFSAISMKLFIGTVHPVGLTISMVAPTLVAVPVTWVFERQKRRLRAALRDLARSNRELKRLHQELEKQANCDFMTGVMTRRHFVSRVTGLLAADCQGALLCIDVDDFKVINDSYGHGVGDTALKKISAAISGVARQQDLVSRIGGEEFAVFLPDASYDDAFSIAEQIRKVAAALEVAPDDNFMHPMSVSIGAAFVVEAHDFGGLIELADQRMYEAKRSGKDRTVFPRPSLFAHVA